MLERINLNSLKNREVIYSGEKSKVISVDESQQYLFIKRGFLMTFTRKSIDVFKLLPAIVYS